MTQTIPSPRHILAMNDAQEVLDLFRDLLEEEGYRVTTRSYIRRDLDEIKCLKPDLIILDYMWSGSDVGWSLLQMLRLDPATKEIPIVLCTGAVAQVQQLESHLGEMGVRVVLKPFDWINSSRLLAMPYDRKRPRNRLDVRSLPGNVDV